jgi:hypothetical protein
MRSYATTTHEFIRDDDDREKPTHTRWTTIPSISRDMDNPNQGASGEAETDPLAPKPNMSEMEIIPSHLILNYPRNQTHF